MNGDGLAIALPLWIPPEVWTNEVRRESNEFGMNFIEIEEHQVGNLVFVQCSYLYNLLKATSACIIAPIAKVPRSKYSNYKYWKCVESHRASADMGGNDNMISSLSWDTKYHVSGPDSR